MHRTQIYLQDNLHSRLRTRAQNIGVSVSELIRRTLDTEIKSDPLADAAAFFERLTPLTGFSSRINGEVNTDAAPTPEAYVRALRVQSRLLRAPKKTMDRDAS